MLQQIPKPAQSQDVTGACFGGFRARPELGRAERSSAEPEPSSAEHFPIAHFWAQPSIGSRGPRVERRQMDPNLSCETLALKSAIRVTKIEIGIQLKKIQIPRVRIHGNWGSHFLIIFTAQDRLF